MFPSDNLDPVGQGDHDAGSPLQRVANALSARGQRCCAPEISLNLAEDSGSRRRRLWELGSHSHCPVLGLCLSVDRLRRLAIKTIGCADEDDYVLHCDAVAAAQHRTVIAEALQRELESRHAQQVRAAAALKTQDDLRRWWQGQRYTPGMAGALWALLTHPRCTSGLERRVLADVHMQQHELGQNLRAQGDRLSGLQKANVELVQDKHQLQNRVDQAMRQLTQQREALSAELMRLRGQLLVKDATIIGLQDELRELRRAQPDLPQRKALAEQLANQNEQLRDLQRDLHLTKQKLLASPAATPITAPAVPVIDTPAAPVRFFENRPAALTALQAQAVLCVGGRTGAVPAYKRLVENIGARFLHHDGGDEDNLQRLAATLAAATLVICQTGCVSHDAYWRVKDHCKRTGTRCVFVNNPSASSLLRALEEAAGAKQRAKQPESADE
jgi:hypothetical protein